MMKQKAAHLALTLLLLFQVDTAAVEFEKLGTSISKALGTTKAFRAPASDPGAQVLYSKNAAGGPAKFAFVQKGIYEPNCTHTWVIAVDAGTAKVTDIRVVEMSCPHAFPCQKASFLEQYKGKGPADVKSLKKAIHTVAKATGSSHLTTDAVVKSITEATKLKGTL